MPKYLPLACIVKHEPAMRHRGVSEVARSRRGFLSMYRAVGGQPARLSAAWQRQRAAFIARHEAQRRRRREPLFDALGRPTRRHLALIAWAYSPGRGCPKKGR